MALFEITREVDLTPQEAWDRLTDWRRHGDLVPLTTVHLTHDGFVARTGVGAVHFDDPMDVVVEREPEYCRLEKRGSVVTGWAEIVVEPHGAGARVTWREDLRVARLPRLFDGVTRLSSRLLFGRVLDGLLAPATPA